MIIIYLFDKHVLRIYYVVGNGLSAGATKRGSQSKRRDRHHTQQMSVSIIRITFKNYCRQFKETLWGLCNSSTKPQKIRDLKNLSK